MNLLIVEDHPTNRKLLRVQLEAEGHAIFEAQDGLEALALLERQPVEAVISDILMPRMDGYRLCHEIRQHAHLCHLPIIIYTSTYTSPSDEKLALDVGADRFLKKPASVEHISSTLHEVIAQPRKPASPTAMKEVDVLKEYSERLVAKLEQKNLELQAAHNELHLSHERFELVARATKDVIWDWDLRTNTLWWNDGYYSAFGYSKEETKPGVESWEEHLHPDDREQVTADVHAAIDKGGDLWTGEYRFRRRDGSYAHILDQGLVVRNEKGEAVRMTGAMTDITERKQLEAQLLRGQRMEAIGALAGGIAHDLNNVLAPILMASELLKLTPVDPDTAHILDTIRDSAQRGAGMVKQILTFARGSEGERGVVQPKHLVKEMVNLALHTFPKTVHIHTDIAADIWTLHGNPTQLHQILLNLCVNARDAMPGGGTLTLTASNVHLDGACTLLAPDAQPGPHVLLSVADTGTGMTPEVRARIFDAFFTTKAPGKGTGLGLSTVRNIVRDHGGFLTVESEPGRGATFKVYLPAQETTATSAGKTAKPALPVGKGELVLVVDDEAAIRRVVEQTLQAFGYRLLIANDGAQAVGLCAQHLSELQLLITDVAMPIMGGRETIRAIRTILPRLPVIAASGSDSLTDSSLRKELDVQAFLHKPFSAEDLVRTVHQVVQGELERP